MVDINMSAVGEAYDGEQAEVSQRVSGLSQPIVLIGLMGAGKTTVGRRLAHLLKRDFVDSDVEIEQAAGCSISDIFAIHGESIFRDLEQRVIHRLLEENKQLVLATGGGAWMQPALREEINDKALSVWLRAELPVLLDRVSRRNHRPLLEQGDKKAILQKLMDERYPIYAKAKLVVDSDDGVHELVVRNIIAAMQDYMKDTMQDTRG